MLIRSLAIAVIQGTGTLMTFFLMFLVLNQYGLNLQGKYSYLRSWVDLMVVLFCLGLPQSIIYSINKYKINSGVLKIKIFLFMPFVFLFVCLLSKFMYKGGADNIDLVLIALSCTFMVGFNLFKSISLTTLSSMRYSLLVIIPSISFMFFYILNSAIMKDKINFAYVVFFGSLVSFVFSIFCVKNNNYTVKSGFYVNLFRDGFFSFIQAVSVVALPFFVYNYLLSMVNLGMREVGVVSVGIYLYFVMNVPLAMFSPILYNRWTGFGSTKAKQELVKIILFGVVVYFFMVFFYFIFNKQIFDYFDILGSDQFIYSIFYFGSISVFFNNILSCYNLSRGLFKLNFLIYFIKFLLVAVVLIVGDYIFDVSLIWYFFVPAVIVLIDFFAVLVYSVFSLIRLEN